MIKDEETIGIYLIVGEDRADTIENIKNGYIFMSIFCVKGLFKKKPQIRVLEKRNEIINIKRLIENRSM